MDEDGEEVEEEEEEVTEEDEIDGDEVMENGDEIEEDEEDEEDEEEDDFAGQFNGTKYRKNGYAKGPAENVRGWLSRVLESNRGLTS